MNPSQPSLTIAVLQAAGAEANVEANIARMARAAHQAKAAGAELLITPEMFLTGYNIGDRLAPLVSGKLENQVQQLAREAGIALAVGTALPMGAGISNAVLLVDDSGTTLARYDKTHLFGELDRALFTAGSTLGPVIEFHGVMLGFLICYDVEFPETVRALTLAGAELLIVPTAQMEPYAFVAEHLIRVRAWENQTAIAYANRVGTEGVLRYVGRSSIVGPDGTVLACADPASEALLIATIDAQAVRAARRQNPYLHDRRPELAVITHPIQKKASA
ncbi:MAG: carbon-nitrogen hydrolase family protein [Comamonas sp.]